MHSILSEELKCLERKGFDMCWIDEIVSGGEMRHSDSKNSIWF